jgi:predicted small secreted protein
MKTPYLPILVVAAALSLASANAMPDLGRETGKFIQNDEPAPKGVRTFEPAKLDNSQASLDILLPWHSALSGQRLSILLPWHSVKAQPHLAILLPWHTNSTQG